MTKNENKTAPKLTEAQREECSVCGECFDPMFGRCRNANHLPGRLVAVRELNRGASGQRVGPAWFQRWDVHHEGVCAGCTDGRHSLHMSKGAARAWAKSHMISLTDAGRAALKDGGK